MSASSTHDADAYGCVFFTAPAEGDFK